ncbi:2-keto-3-deoxy-galactonokinase [Dyella thiooxydans]|uniref:2-keto-3-deoxy-galactonokinase n=1 Tax=Dyella thiooxydans TaxID=445710 RepID=A0A160N3U5_9GAMM|nr:2-dehydro-3-deoxygalactonokinase [Dyella thiooxydans]AND70218.1 2-keto-3-deoxy-galactonokinase [Dyella thiooxydans]
MAGLIGLDWGTSSLRAYRLDADGAVAEVRARPWGIRQLPEGGFDAALADVTAGWPALPRLACGMVGSRNGWCEVPYLDLPADAAALGRALHPFAAGDGGALYLVPGLRNPRGPDVMRGEETQLFGALARDPSLAAHATFVLPGTHSKWASVRDGAVVDFSTAMTGELFALLRRHSILGAGIGEGAADPEAFARGVIAARDSGAAGGLSRLFSARALMLDGALAPSAVPDYLSGLLLGEELRAQLASGRFGTDAPIQLIGDAALCARYRAAAVHFDLCFAEPLADIVAAGLWQLAVAAGRVADPLVVVPKEARSC